MISGVLTTLCFLLGMASDSVESQAMNAWFLRMYLPEVRRTERVYGELSLHATTELLTSSGGSNGDARQARYWACDGCYRVDTRHEPYLDRALTMIAGHDFSAVIWKDHRGSNHRPCPVKCSPRDAVLQQIRVVMPLAFAPWCWHQQSVEELFLEENATITGLSVTADPQLGRVCNISWKYRDRGVFREGGEFSFAMDRSWVLLRVSRSLNDSTRLEGCFTYGDEEIAGVPVIRTAEYWCETLRGRTQHMRMTRNAYAIMSSRSDLFDPCREQIRAALACTSAPAHGRWGAVAPGLLGLGAVVVALQGWRHFARRNTCFAGNGFARCMRRSREARRPNGTAYETQEKACIRLRDSGRPGV
ncbi:hypothetical protein Mal4_33990 [Maioricimonas rarisocia]|uniref:Uncharacterized protein n=1 Tax=Maioricimonas rarisocia TaxID=2528026 RepID=A0A517Z9A5_9PLAN|nr:hypothetical protein [Maioricimonas rarisocia]QDU39064.1 hypothetical protein Mal4_33990 [Maioricimonas rarisocia]